MPLATSFWETFVLLLVFVPLVMIWAFAVVDIFGRHDLAGIWKAVWLLVVFLLPVLGTVVYLAVRPRDPAPSRAPDLQVLADLHDRGKLTDEEFAAEKARVLGHPTTAPATAP